MRRLIRAILFTLGLLVVVAVAGLVAVILLADKAVKSTVETAGTKALKVGVSVGKANASILTGAIGLQDTTIANPPGFQGSALVKLQRVDATVDTKSLFGTEVLIKDMKLDNMEVFLEQKGLQNNLYQVIEPLRKPHQPTGRSLVIDSLEIANVTVHVGMPAVPGQTQGVELKLASIKMGDLGRNEKMDMAVLISKIALAVAEGITQQGGGILPQGVTGQVGSVLDKALDIGKTIFTPGAKTSDGKQQDSLGKTITDGVIDLFGGKKK